MSTLMLLKAKWKRVHCKPTYNFSLFCICFLSQLVSQIQKYISRLDFKAGTHSLARPGIYHYNCLLFIINPSVTDVRVMLSLSVIYTFR